VSEPVPMKRYRIRKGMSWYCPVMAGRHISHLFKEGEVFEVPASEPPSTAWEELPLSMPPIRPPKR
jgi:hypothetical protein